MQTQRSRRVAATAIALAASCALAGPLNPPAGPATPTNKTLDQVEPRRPINDLPGAPNAVHVITEPGSYYLTGDITGSPGQHCVVVDLASSSVDDPAVTIDFRGFTIRGGPGSLDGIHCVAPPGEPVGGINVSVEQIVGGTITDTGGDAIHCENVLNTNIVGLTITNCGGDAVEIDNSALMGTPLSSGRKALCQWITASYTGGDGVRVISTQATDIQNCTITNTSGDGIVVNNADAVTFNGLAVLNAGADAARVTNVSAFGVSEEGIKITAPTGNGLVAEDCDSVSLANLTITNAGMDACRVIRVSSFGVSEEGIKITAPTGDGLYVEDGAAVAIANINISDTGGDGIQFLQLPGLIEATYEIEVANLTNITGDALNAQDCPFISLSNVNISGANNGVVVTRAMHVNHMQLETDFTRIANVSNNGIVVTGIDDVLINRSSVSNAGANGANIAAVLQCQVRGLHVTGNGADGLRVANAHSLSVSGLSAVSNAAYGATIDTVEICVGYQDNYLNSNGTGGAGGGGIWANDVSSLALTGTVIDENLGDGLLVTASAAGTPSVTLKKKKIRKNTGRGIAIDVGSGSITDCDLVANGNYGIETGAGFSGSITHNRLIDNAGPILVNGFGCNVTANAATVGALGFIAVPTPGNVVGPIVDETNVGSSCSPFANIRY